jgi:hypothetical protein
MGVEQVLIVLPDGRAELSPPMMQRLRFEDRRPIYRLRTIPGAEATK